MESDNQGVKEEIFIQTSRKGGAGQLGWRGLAARWHWRTGVDEAVAGGPIFVC